MLWLGLCSGWDREHVAIIFANEGGQSIKYIQPEPNQFLIALLTRPKIVDTVLMFILPRAYPH